MSPRTSAATLYSGRDIVGQAGGEISGYPDKIRAKRQDTPLNQNFSEFYDGVSCLFVPVEQKKKLQAKVYSKNVFLVFHR